MDIEDKVTEEQCKPKPIQRFYVVAYRVALIQEERKEYFGVAMVKAKDVHDAENTFLSETQFNAYRDRIHIGKIEEINESVESMLLAEEWVFNEKK